MKRASLLIRMRGSFLSMPLMMRRAASFGVVFAAFSGHGGGAANRSHGSPRQVRKAGTMIYIFSEWN